MADCEQCGGQGWYPVPVTVPVCCQCPTETGECCGQPIAGQEQQQEQCAACGGTGMCPSYTTRKATKDYTVEDLKNEAKIDEYRRTQPNATSNRDN